MCTAIFFCTVAGTVAGAGPLVGQTAASHSVPDAPPVRATDAAASADWIAPPGALPSILVPPVTLADGSVALQGGAGPVPVLSAIVGGIAGMFVGRWWMQRGCDENCDERGFLGLLAGGLLGTVIGWMAGGGEMTDPGPPRRD
jgi:hypothetical protein